MTQSELAELIAITIQSQGNEIDNVGDGATIVFQNDCPTIDCGQLAEIILSALKQ